jgi:CheY-like chemotaxis protein
MIDLASISSWSVLIVDDEPDNLEIVAETLGFFGLTVKTARNGLEGLTMLREFSPQLILLDLSMPKMDGWEMRTRVKTDLATQHIPVVALSAHAMAGDRTRALEAGFDGYLTKPINVATILTDICNTLQENGKNGSKPAASEPAAAEMQPQHEEKG